MALGFVLPPLSNVSITSVPGSAMTTPTASSSSSRYYAVNSTSTTSINNNVTYCQTPAPSWAGSDPYCDPDNGEITCEDLSCAIACDGFWRTYSSSALRWTSQYAQTHGYSAYLTSQEIQPTPSYEVITITPSPQTIKTNGSNVTTTGSPYLGFSAVYLSGTTPTESYYNVTMIDSFYSGPEPTCYYGAAFCADLALLYISENRSYSPACPGFFGIAQGPKVLTAVSTIDAVSTQPVGGTQGFVPATPAPSASVAPQAAASAPQVGGTAANAPTTPPNPVAVAQDNGGAGSSTGGDAGANQGGANQGGGSQGVGSESGGSQGGGNSGGGNQGGASPAGQSSGSVWTMDQDIPLAAAALAQAWAMDEAQPGGAATSPESRVGNGVVGNEVAGAMASIIAAYGSTGGAIEPDEPAAVGAAAVAGMIAAQAANLNLDGGQADSILENLENVAGNLVLDSAGKTVSGPMVTAVAGAAEVMGLLQSVSASAQQESQSSLSAGMVASGDITDALTSGHWTPTGTSTNAGRTQSATAPSTGIAKSQLHTSGAARTDRKWACSATLQAFSMAAMLSWLSVP
jgi:hypothetical protein